MSDKELYPLTERLRCNYMGRSFAGPAPKGMLLPSSIMLEAANKIDHLAAQLKEANDEAFKREARIMMYVNQLAEKDQQLLEENLQVKRLESQLTAAHRQGWEQAKRDAEKIALDYEQKVYEAVGDPRVGNFTGRVARLITSMEYRVA